MISAIHQPNFMPWLGYFDKIRQSEQFIFFDSVALSNGKTWTTRTKISLNKQEHWLTMPVKKSGRSGQKICDVEMLDHPLHWSKLLKTVFIAYKKAAYFDETYTFLRDFEAFDSPFLADFNIHFIQKTSQRLFENPPLFRRASHKPQLLAAESLKTDYIIDTCRAFEVQHYLAGQGQSLEFLQTALFRQNGIQLAFQHFSHPIYEQKQPFLRGLSIIDALMHLGFEGSSQLLSPQSAR